MAKEVIFDEMGFLSKYLPGQRLQFLDKKVKKYSELSDKYGSEFEASNFKDVDAECNFCKNTLLKFLYKAYRLNGRKNIQQHVINAYFNWMHHTDDLASPAYQKMLNDLKDDRVVTSLLHKIFTDEFVREWEAQKVVKAQAAREKQEKRARLEGIVSSLESELSRLKSMFSSMSGFSRTQISVSIDMTESRLSQFRAELASLS